MAAVVICVALLYMRGYILSGETELKSSEKNKITFMNELDMRPEVTVFSVPLAKESSSYVASDYIYNNFLSYKQRNCYDYVYQSIISRQNLNFEQADFADDKQGLIATLDISEYGLTADELAEMWISLLHDHIELYYVDETLYSYRDDNVSYLSIVCPYKYNMYSSRQAVNTELDKQVSLLKELTEEMTDEEKACYVCTYLSDLYSYSTDENGNAILDVDSTMISGILNKSGVCSGYSRMYAFLCRQLGMECLFVTGEVENGSYHAWNYINANGWYAVDPTFVDGGVDGVLLAGNDFTNKYCADLPGLHYDTQGMKFGYPLPVLEEEGYFEKSYMQAADDKKTETNEEPAQKNEEPTQQNDESVNITENMTESIVTDIETSPDIVPSASDITNQDIQAGLSSDNTTAQNCIPVLAEELSPMELSTTYFILGCQEQENGNLEKAIEYYNSSLNYYNNSGSLYNMANIYRDLGDIDIAVKYYAMAYYNGDGTSSIDNCILMLHNADLDSDKRLEYDDYLLQYAPIKKVYEDIAYIYLEKNDYKTAQEYFNIAAGM